MFIRLQRGINACCVNSDKVVKIEIQKSTYDENVREPCIAYNIVLCTEDRPYVYDRKATEEDAEDELLDLLAEIADYDNAFCMQAHKNETKTK